MCAQVEASSVMSSRHVLGTLLILCHLTPSRCRSGPPKLRRFRCQEDHLLADFAFHNVGPNPAAAPPAFETALQDFLNSGIIPEEPATDVIQPISSLQQLSSGLKAMPEHKKDLSDAAVPQQVKDRDGLTAG